MIGRGRLQPQPTSPPPLAAWDSSAWRAKAAIQRARVQPPPPRAAAAPAPRGDRGETDRPTDAPSRSIPEEWVMGDGGKGGGLILPGLGHPSPALFL